MASFFIRIDVTSEAVYELVAEPIQEPQAEEPQAEEAAEHATEEVANPADLQGKPRNISLIFKYSMLYLKYCAFTFKELIGTLDAWSLGFLSHSTSIQVVSTAMLN